MNCESWKSTGVEFGPSLLRFPAHSKTRVGLIPRPEQTRVRVAWHRHDNRVSIYNSPSHIRLARLLLLFAPAVPLDRSTLASIIDKSHAILPQHLISFISQHTSVQSTPTV